MSTIGRLSELSPVQDSVAIVKSAEFMTVPNSLNVVSNRRRWTTNNRSGLSGVLAPTTSCL